MTSKHMVMVAVGFIVLAGCATGQTGAPVAAPRAYVSTTEGSASTASAGNSEAACLLRSCRAPMLACGPSCHKVFACVVSCHEQQECIVQCLYGAEATGLNQAAVVIGCWQRSCAASYYY